MSYYDIEDYEAHECRRPCVDDARPMTCDYDFLVEHYHTLTKACYDCPFNQSACSLPHCIAADGSLRGLIVVNRMMPGPAIHVCEGDHLRVRVHNKLEMSESTSIHWHGVLQMGNAHMDGVGMVTQCPIPPHTAFTYTFKADTPGTHYWHSHSGMQRADGMFGHLVIRQAPSREPMFHQYDYDLPEHTFLVHDWFVRETAATFAKHHHSDGTNKPESMLINGKGVYQTITDPSTNTSSVTPREELVMEPGKRYRMRVASNGIVLCPIRISVDGHVLEVIATDGSPVEPLEVESFTIHAGERYDFVLTTNQPVATYLLRAAGLGDCEKKGAKQTAILRYQGAPRDVNYMTPAPELNGINLNPYNQKSSQRDVQVTELTSLLEDDPALTREPDRRFTFAMDFSRIDNPRFHNKDLYSLADVDPSDGNLLTPQLNHITMIFPPAPALTQLVDIPKEMICNKASVGQNCTDVFCSCIHLQKVALGDVVEMLVVDEGHPWNAGHPMHLHGHGFRVVAMDKLNDTTWAHEVEELDRQGQINRTLTKAPKKDTVAVPDGGYVVLRFYANNPGMWFFHCHIEFHAEIGMGVVFQVGEPNQFPPKPKRFPTCGSWEAGLSDPDNEFHDLEEMCARVFDVTDGGRQLSAHLGMVLAAGVVALVMNQPLFL